MTNHDFNTIASADGTEMDVYIAHPEEGNHFPGIILLQEAAGVNGHIRNIAERLSSEGYYVIAPDLYHRTVRRLEAGYTDFGQVAPHYQALTRETLTIDLEACYHELLQQPNIIKGKIGSVGFCLGGKVSLLANARLPLSAAVSYYGGGMDEYKNEIIDLHGPHLFYWAGLDAHIPQETVDTVMNEVKKAGKDYTAVTYSYAQHGFNCDERDSYHRFAAKEAWANTLNFLNNRLK